jgi:hypothetical protein
MRILICILAAAAVCTAGASSYASSTPTPQAAQTSGFAKKFTDVNAQILCVGEIVGDTVDHASKRTDGYLYGAFDVTAREMGRLRQRLGRLHPPSALSDSYLRLRRAMRSVHRDLRAIARAARRHDPDAAGRAVTRLVVDSAELRSARRVVVRAVHG